LFEYTIINETNNPRANAKDIKNINGFERRIGFVAYSKMEL
jgi:hypothetical protein